MGKKTTCINGELNINDLVISTGDDDYAYLIGYVSEIRPLGSPEHDTENDEDDVHVNFSEFDYSPTRIREIESMFSDLYGYPKVFDELALDDVIMGPSCLIKITGIDEAVLSNLLGCEANAAEYCSSMIAGGKAMCDCDNMDIHYFEVCFSNGNADTETWICIKGVSTPTVSEANEFCAKDVELYNAKVVSVDPIDKLTAQDCYDFSNEANWPIFG